MFDGEAHRIVEDLPPGRMIEMRVSEDGTNQLADRLTTDLPIPFLIESQARKTPKALAISHYDTHLTYGELLERSNALAQGLKTLGLARGAVVGIYSERSAALIVSALGIMRAGGAYMPLDPSYPSERLAYQLQDAGAAILIIGQSEVGEELTAKATHVLRCSRDGKFDGPTVESSFSQELTNDDLAYVIYTSGSTGRPKGVEITHGCLTNFVRWFEKEFELAPADQVSHVCAVGFDVAISEIWPTLVVGATIHIADKEIATDAETLHDWLLEEKVTSCWVPTPMAEHLLALDWPTTAPLRLMTTAGDTLHSFPRPRLPFRFANAYGPTECTVYATSAFLQPTDRPQGLPPIGWPLANTQIYIVDEFFRRVPNGVEGEIWIGGRCVARGYRNHPELTAEKFVPNVFEPHLGSRLYRSGDRGFILPDGQIAFRGRIDNQIKLHGVRIEPGEIEALLNEHPAVKQSVVVTREFRSGDKRLVAYIAPSSQAVPSVRELRDFLAKCLPAPMIPAVFVLLEELPLNASGKIDRRGLPAPKEGNMLAVGAGTPPRDQLEKQLQHIWEDLLEVQNIGVQQDFFELGGDSLLAVRLLVSLEKELSFKLPLSALLEARTIEDLARTIRNGANSHWSSLVAVQPFGSKPPLFCIHSHTGDVMYCEYIARGAGSNQPIYGLQSQAVLGKPPHTTVEEMSEHYLKEVRRIQPNGPYYLFGFCFGGMVAFDMARRLSAEGEVVPYLGLYNAPAPGTLKGWPLGQFSYLVKRTRNELLKLPTMTAPQKVDHLTKNVRNFGLMLLRTARIEMWRAWRFTDGNGNNNGLRDKMVNLEQLNIAAAKNFAPSYVYPGRIILYLAPEVADVYPTAPEVGWRAFASDGVTAIEVPLNEDAWRGTPFVETVGGSLKQYIQPQRAQARAAGAATGNWSLKLQDT